MIKLITALFLLSLHVNCSTLDDENWWKTATFYQIYPKSFKDSDKDGIGDLNGIIDKLEYIEDLGVTGIWISPIFKSPQKDQGYDISDYEDIDPQFGNLENLRTLIEEAHERGLKVILDFVPNHSSDQHKWFHKSVNGEEGYADYYVWSSGKNGSRTVPPNNWISNFSHSAWEWNERREEFYLHQFLKEQPDLNYRNPAVREEMKDILNYWLDKHDADGVRIDAVPFLLEDQRFRDEPRSNALGASNIDYTYLDHVYTLNQPESYELVYEWRSHIDSVTAKTKRSKICMTEAVQDTDKIVPFYGNADGTKLGAHFSFNFILLSGLQSTSNAQDLSNWIKEWLEKLPKIYTSNWVLGNHDQHRIATKVGKERVDLLNMLTGFLPGIQITYNGEEIGMENGKVTCQNGVDLISNCTAYPFVSRDFERTPMQWDGSEFAGFTDGNTTWLPVSSKKDGCNVQDQLKDPKSHLNVYKQIQKVRKQLREQTEIDLKVLAGDDVLELIRYNKEGGKKVNVFELVLNFGVDQKCVQLSEAGLFEIVLSSGNSSRNTGDTITRNLDLDPYEALILKSSS